MICPEEKEVGSADVGCGKFVEVTRVEPLGAGGVELTRDLLVESAEVGVVFARVEVIDSPSKTVEVGYWWTWK